MSEGEGRPIVGTKALWIAVAIVALALFAFWIGYGIGKDIAQRDNARDAASQTAVDQAG